MKDGVKGARFIGGGFSIRSWISLLVSRAKSENDNMAGVSLNESRCERSLRALQVSPENCSSRMVATSLVKNSARSSARTSGGACEGSTGAEKV